MGSIANKKVFRLRRGGETMEGVGKLFLSDVLDTS